MSHPKRKRELLALMQDEASKHGGTVTECRRAKGAHVQVRVDGPHGHGMSGFTCSRPDPRAHLNLRAQIKHILHNGKKPGQPA